MNRTVHAISRSVTVHFMKRGIHCYPEAATRPDLATGDKYDVSYLAHPHAHDFWFKVTVSVVQNDRDIEFLQLRDRLSDLYDNGILDCGRKSVETMAEELIEQVLEMYPGRSVEVSVYEDSLTGCGGTVSYTPIASV